MAKKNFRVKKALSIEPQSAAPSAGDEALGDIYVDSSTKFVNAHNGTDWKVLVDTSSTQSLTNKTLDNTSTIELKDTLFTLQDDGNSSKKAQFQLSGITASNTRVMTIPNFDGTLATLAGTEALTNKTLDNTNTIELKDTLFTLQDDGNSSKKAQFQLSGITASNTRVMTVPDFNGTLATLAGTETMTNKTLTGNIAVNLVSGAATVTLPTTTSTLATLALAEVITNKDHDGGTASNTSRLTVPKDTATNLTALTRKQGTILFDTTNNILKVDNGSTLDSVATTAAATSSTAGILKLATQSIMEAATNTDTAVVPSVVMNHPGVAKAFAVVNQVGTQALLTSYGIASITDTAQGSTKFTFTTAFSSTNYSVAGVLAADALSASDIYMDQTSNNTATTTDCIVLTVIPGTSLSDNSRMRVVFYGDV